MHTVLPVKIVRFFGMGLKVTAQSLLLRFRKVRPSLCVGGGGKMKARLSEAPFCCSSYGHVMPGGRHLSDMISGVPTHLGPVVLTVPLLYMKPWFQGRWVSRRLRLLLRIFHSP